MKKILFGMAAMMVVLVAEAENISLKEAQGIAQQFLQQQGRNGSVSSVGYSGYYWSSSLFSSDVQGAYYLDFDSGGVYWQDDDGRCLGCAVRGVLGENS